MKFSWYLYYTSTLKLHGVSGDEPEEEEDLHEDQGWSSRSRTPRTPDVRRSSGTRLQDCDETVQRQNRQQDHRRSAPLPDARTKLTRGREEWLKHPGIQIKENEETSRTEVLLRNIFQKKEIEVKRK